MKNEIFDSIRENLQQKKDFVNEIKTYLITSTETISLEKGRYNEYLDGILIKDITSSEQFSFGITILHVLANKETDFSIHMHENQSQTVKVQKGKILDLENNITFHPGESFFVSKCHPHRLRYYENTELIIVYMPALNSI